MRKAMIEQAAALGLFRDVATLRTAPVERPPDGALDRERGARAASALEMGGWLGGWLRADGPSGGHARAFLQSAERQLRGVRRPGAAVRSRP